MELRQGLVNATLLGWAGVILVLFRVVGPRWAGIIAVLVGSLFLPPGQVLPRVHPAIPLVGTTVTGLALLAGMIATAAFRSDRARPAVTLRWPDLVMVGFVVAPAMGLVQHSLARAVVIEVVDTILYRSLTWLVPYAFARRELADPNGPRDVLRAVVVAGLLTLPIVFYEAVAGPDRYVLGLIYGLRYHEAMVNRLGGWRPEGFLHNGIYLASWMAIASTAGTWLALGRRRGPGALSGWVAARSLLAGSLVCRGVYGLILLALGVGTTLVTQLGRTRALIVALALVAPVYASTRVAGLWDGQTLVRFAGPTGRSSTVAVRLGSEDEVLQRLAERSRAWGDGVNLWASDVRLAGFWPDGKWIFLVWTGGVIGLTLAYAALHLVPIGLAVSEPRGRRPTRGEAGSPAWGLAVLASLHLIDGLHNGFDFGPTALMAGSLVSLRLPAVATVNATDHEPRRNLVVRLAVVVLALLLPELVGIVARFAGR